LKQQEGAGQASRKSVSEEMGVVKGMHVNDKEIDRLVFNV
jgi:hypothetical protein